MASMLPSPPEDVNPPLMGLLTASSTAAHSLLLRAVFPCSREDRNLLAVLIPLVHFFSDSFFTPPSLDLPMQELPRAVLQSLFFQLCAFTQSDLMHSHCFKYHTSNSQIYNFSLDLFTGSRLIYLITYLSSLRLAHKHLKLNLPSAEFLISRQWPLPPYYLSGLLGVILNTFSSCTHPSPHPFLSPPPFNQMPNVSRWTTALTS